MAVEKIKCPHCECKVSIADVEKEDGFCPECGQLVMASSLQDNFDNDLDDEDQRDMDGYEREDDDWGDDDMQDDILDELNDDPGSFDEEGRPISKRRRSGPGFSKPQANPSASKRGKKKK